jgi:hypothetical protein
VLAIAIWDLAYPLLTDGFDLKLGAWLNVTALFSTANHHSRDTALRG